MNDIKIFDNFLEKNYFKDIKQILSGPYFPWYFNSGVIYDKEKDLDNYQFTHCFYSKFSPQSDYFINLNEILRLINPCSLIRIKANLLPKTEKIIEHGYHIDIPYLKDGQKSFTALLYVNSNNGYTKFETGQIINSIENRFVIFDSKISHTGSTCTDEKSRIVINFNYF